MFSCCDRSCDSVNCWPELGGDEFLGGNSLEKFYVHGLYLPVTGEPFRSPRATCYIRKAILPLEIYENLHFLRVAITEEHEREKSV
jgi:hypothetical protein